MTAECSSKGLRTFRRIVLLAVSFALLCTIAWAFRNERAVFITHQSRFHVVWRSVLDDYDSSSYVMLPDAEAARRIAEVHFQNITHDDPAYSAYAPRLVFFDEEDSIWIVRFWHKWLWNDPVHGDWCIAMRQADGEVLAIWVEE